MHSARQLFWIRLFALLALASAACTSTVDSDDDQQDETEQSGGQVTATSTTAVTSAAVPRTTGVPTMQPTSAEDLGIVLDETGRPYDYYRGPDGTTTETRLLTRLQIDRGRMEIADGGAFYGPLRVTIRDTESVNFATATELDVRIVWQQRPADSEPPAPEPGTRVSNQTEFYPVGRGANDGLVEAILGVQISVRGETVDRWDRFELAYETDEGLGVVTSRAVLEWADRNVDFGQPTITEELPQDRPYLVLDLDDQPGPDLLLFDNGNGRGPAVLTEGFNAEGQLVAVMLWSPRYPWRLAVPEGSPPADVVEREQELIDCIEGRRLIDKWGRCT